MQTYKYFIFFLSRENANYLRFITNTEESGINYKEKKETAKVNNRL